MGYAKNDSYFTWGKERIFMSTEIRKYSINLLYPEDIGKFVYYTYHTKERGKIKSYDNQRRVAWVVFLCDENWENFSDYTANMCDYKNLTLCE